MRGKFTKSNAADLDAGSLRLPRVSLTLRRHPLWRAQLHITDTISNCLPPPPLDCQDFRPRSHANSVNHLQAREFLDSFYLVCRKCNSRRLANKVNPRKGYAWAILTCINTYCRESRPANAWNCTCNTPWRSCSLHAHWLTHASFARRLAESPRTSRSKRFPEPSTDPPPVLNTKRRLRSDDTMPSLGQLGSSFNWGNAPASSSSARPKRSRTDQQDVTLRLLAKMPKLAAKFAHLVQQSLEDKDI